MKLELDVIHSTWTCGEGTCYNEDTQLLINGKIVVFPVPADLYRQAYEIEVDPNHDDDKQILVAVAYTMRKYFTPIHGIDDLAHLDIVGIEAYLEAAERTKDDDRPSSLSDEGLEDLRIMLTCYIECAGEHEVTAFRYTFDDDYNNSDGDYDDDDDDAEYDDGYPACMDDEDSTDD